MRVAWLSLDEGDNDPARFLTYFVSALQTLAVNMGAGVLGVLQAPQLPPIESILTGLLNEIAAFPDQFTLVLDDYHLMDSKPVDLALTFLIEHLPSLTNALAQTYRINPDKVAIQVQTGNILLDLDTAIPCGLIVNELVSNSLKYAFPNGESGQVNISCHLQQGGKYTLVVSDDGVGLPAGFNPMKTTSLGLKLVSSLAKQIGGNLLVDGSHGTRFEINFSKS